jgi:3-methylcrotonyl-CoA carboxylase alpha subunit
VGAGTVEFIVEQPGGYGAPEQMKFYFMEMNTRLQVEHPVTEAITMIDLVKWQLRVASGEPLPLRQEDLRIHGHAIEARICAENPDHNFLPATGRLTVYRKPSATSFALGTVRIDDGVRQDDAISPYYDSMIAKLIVRGATRQEALGRLDAALAEVRIAGVQTNVQFLRRVIATSSFSQEQLDTALIEREREHLFHQDPLGVELTAAAAVAQRIVTERAAETADPFSRTDGFRSHGVASRRVDLEYQGQPVVAKLRYLDDGLMLKVGEAEPQTLSINALADDRIDVRYGNVREVVQVFELGEQLHVFGTRGAAQIAALDVLARASESGVQGGRLTAPMPGKVISINVKSGDTVKQGQPLAVMEAMKMEHTIAAPADGVVAEVLYAPGDQVTEGAELLRLTQPGAAQ